MKVLLLKQTDGFVLMTADAWKSHLSMVRMNLLQEEDAASAEEIVLDYKNSFEETQLTDREVRLYQKEFHISVNQEKKISSFFGNLIHF